MQPQCSQPSLVAQMVKSLPTMRETWVQSLCWKLSWRRKWQTTPVLLPGKSHGQRSLVGYTVHGVSTERLHFHFSNVHRTLFTIAKTGKQTKRPLTDEWIKKNVVHIYNGILFSHKNERMLLVATWMELEMIILSEVRQREIP